MAVELAAAIAAVKAVSSLVKESSTLVESVADGLGGRNKRAKQELREKLDTLQQHLGRASDLARVAEAYSRAHEQVVTLRQLCERVDDFVRDNMEALSTRSTSPEYTTSWRLVERLVDPIDDNRDLPIGAVRDRERWYDTQDKAQIELRLADFNNAYRDAKSALRQRFARDLEAALRQMVEPLREVEVFLESTMYDKVFRALQTLGAEGG